jgi:DNA-binding XRE family transcriptional regulator
VTGVPHSGFPGGYPGGEATPEAENLEREIREGAPDAARAEASPPPGVTVLCPGALEDVRLGLLFVVEPGDTAVLLAGVEAVGPGGYAAVVPVLAARMPGADQDAFTSYGAESFLDEFFPGEETEVEIGAAALAARNRAHTLAEARQRMRMTQAQVAQRMDVRQERVSAIERAEPGATEVRTLAAYVRALGGRLEIVADIDGERIVLA